MKKIVLLGDSIRAGYDKYVKLAFKNSANVYYPAENCRFAAYILRTLPDWIQEMQCGNDVDCVHWNTGLWDDLHIIDGKPLTPIDLYGEYIDRICFALKKFFPTAKFIFATSTHVLEEQYTNPEFKRYNKITEEYNEKAVKIVTQHGFFVNDLYPLTKQAPDIYHSDMTHFYTKDGTKLITDKVIDSIEKCLKITATPLDYENLFADDVEVIGI